MPATVQSDEIINTLLLHLKGKVNSAVVMTFEFNKLRIQSSNDFLLDTEINCITSPDMIGKEYCIIITGSINLFNTDRGTTTISVDSTEFAVISQDDISISYELSFNERVHMDRSSLRFVSTFRTSLFTEMAYNTKRISLLSKLLEVGEPAIVNKFGYCYCMYSNCISVVESSKLLPDFEIPYQTFNNLTKTLSSGSLNLYVDDSSNIMVMELPNGSIISVYFKIPNNDRITMIETRISELSTLGIFSFKSLTPLERFVKYYPKEKVSMMFYEDKTVGISASTLGNKSIHVNSKNVNPLLSIYLSSVQFDCVFRNFKDDIGVTVSSGKDIICLKSSTRTILISGMTF